MHFEGREIKPYSAPVESGSLQEGQIYFSVTFVDEDMLIPELLPLVFIGSEVGDEGADEYFFQDAESYRAGIRIESAQDTDQVDLFCCGESGLNSVFEFERALDVLLRCSLRRMAG